MKVSWSPVVTAVGDVFLVESNNVFFDDPSLLVGVTLICELTLSIIIECFIRVGCVNFHVKFTMAKLMITVVNLGDYM